MYIGSVPIALIADKHAPLLRQVAGEEVSAVKEQSRMVSAKARSGFRQETPVGGEEADVGQHAQEIRHRASKGVLYRVAVDGADAYSREVGRARIKKIFRAPDNAPYNVGGA
ncbi:MAG: hypothetical protein DDT37_01972 [Firmicutes bacterium]|nr:hypothetical protein [candidate division NPL-UPA2 bacterium]